MTDIFGNPNPVPLGDNEEWYNGNVIRKITKPIFSKYIVYRDLEEDMSVVAVQTREDAIEWCLDNPTPDPDRTFKND